MITDRLRVSESLNAIFPVDDPRYLRVRIANDDAVLGWAVALDTRMEGHGRFGNLRVGSLIDYLAAPADAPTVIRATTRFLEARGVDMTYSTPSHTDWIEAFGACGYVVSKPRRVLALSKQLIDKLEPFAAKVGRIHLTASDGDGPIGL